MNQNNSYHDNEAMSQTKLKEFKRSPRHFFAKYIAEDRIPEVQTEAMKLGKAVHCCVFEYKNFITQYVTEPIVNKRTKEGKSILDEFINDNKDKIIITKEDMSLILCIRNSILNKNTAKFLLAGGVAEREFFWTDEDTGVNCKAKLDYFIEPCQKFPDGLIIDLKTTVNADAQEFSKSIYNFGYYNQQAFYCQAIKTIYKTENYPTFIFVAVEKSAPFECGFFAGDDLMLDIGLKENKKLLNIYKSCIKSNKWGGYEDKVTNISLPNWALNKLLEDA